MLFSFFGLGEITIISDDASTDLVDCSAPTLCNQSAIDAALQQGHLTGDQALWLHQHQIDWEIRVELEP